MCSQVLRSAVHNYPSCTNMIWDKIQDNVLDLLQIENFEDQKYDANIGPPGPKEEPSIKTRCLVAGIKVMSYINIFYSCRMKSDRILIFGSFSFIAFLSSFSAPFHFFDLAFYCLFSFFDLVFYHPLFSSFFFAFILSWFFGSCGFISSLP
jgi:hypothetical protein